MNPGKNAEACFNCHLETHAEFNLPQHHPVIENRMNCVQCHDPHGGDIFKPSGGLAMARLNVVVPNVIASKPGHLYSSMRQCAKGARFVTVRMARSIASCWFKPIQIFVCAAMFRFRARKVPANEFFIGKVAHGAKMQSGTCWASGCHTAVHGSNIQPRMLF